MKLRQCVVLLAMLIMLIASRVYADTVAEYIIGDESYDSSAQIYTAEVYLDTKEHLSAGTFGLRYDALILPVFDIDVDNFAIFQDFPNKGNNYIVFQWYLCKEAPETTGKIHLGTITVNGVAPGADGKPAGWNTGTLRQLDWFATPESKDPLYARTQYVCLNDEIFKRREGIAPLTGYYQGLNVINENTQEWRDIGFIFSNGLELPEPSEIVISGVVNSYNPGNRVTAAVYDDGGNVVGITQAADDPAQPNGAVRSAYSITVPSDAKYRLEIKKDVHLTYKMEIEVGDKDISVGDITLYCGDINADEKIKLYDRTELLQRLNQQSDGEALVCDLNGDGKVTIFDLNIMKLYYNRSYGEVASYVEKE